MSKHQALTPSLLLARLTKLTSTIGGLDASLMLVQYSSPIVIALLLRLAALKGRLGRGGKVRAPSGSGSGSGFGLQELAAGWGKMGGSIGEARVVMRAFGLLPIIQWLLALHPSPLTSLQSLLDPSTLAKSLTSAKVLPTLQVLSLLLYYPLEHVTWLTRKGVVPLSERRAGRAELWSVRFWALYVLLEIYKLRETYLSLLRRTKLLRSTKPRSKIDINEAEGYELSSTKAEGSSDAGVKAKANVEDGVGSYEADASQLKKEWEDWKIAVAVNSGYAPLTVHWSTPGGLWSSPLITGALGSIAAVGSLTSAWRKSA